MYKINFIANAIDRPNRSTYENFLIPFTFFALLNNPNSHVEIIVLDKSKFINKYKTEIEALRKINTNFLIRNLSYKLNKNVFNTYRFFERPVIKAEYTYIADVDIMFTENVLEEYTKNWPLNLCYNNILRPKKTKQHNSRLTGVHMVKTSSYYTKKFKEVQNKYYNQNKSKNDESILCKMCKEIHGLPDFSHRWRPVLGIHFSPNRGKNKSMHLKTYKKYYDIFFNIKDKHPDIFKFKIFSDLEKILLNEFIIV